MAVGGGEIRALTGLRGAAALTVLAYHFESVPLAYPTVPIGHRMATHLSGPGYLMVDLFFILSGFVMARTYAGAFRATPRWGVYARFLEARFARIYPLYAAIVVTVFGLTRCHVMTSASFPTRALLVDLPLLQNLGIGLLGHGLDENLAPPAWSISAEIGAYLLFPALVPVALFRSRRLSACLVAGAFATLSGLSILPRDWLGAGFADAGPLNISSGQTLWPLLRCLAGFSIGLVVWRIAAGRVSNRRRFWLGDVALVAALLALWWRPGSDILVVAIFPALVLQLCTDRSPLARLLGSPIPHRLGDWSYGIYLLHWPMLSLMPAVLPTMRSLGLPHAWPLALGVIAAATISMAAVLHAWLERPARAALRTLFRRRRLPIGAEPSAP